MSSSISNVLDLERDLDLETAKLVQQAKSWGLQHLEPLISSHWENATFPKHILSSFRLNCPNLLGYTLPRKYGGQGYNLLTSCHISRTLATIDASFTTTLLVQYGLCAESILLCGTEEQKLKLIPLLANLDKMGCFCLTEPQSGSDASDLSTIATKCPAGGGYTITGSKRWIGNALTSEIFIVWAKNTSIKGNPVMGFIVQRSHQRNLNAIKTSKIEGKVSMRILQNANVEFVDAYCPDSNVMVDHGTFFLKKLYYYYYCVPISSNLFNFCDPPPPLSPSPPKKTNKVGFAQSVGRVLEVSRVSVAWIPVGICQGAVEKTIEYVKKRSAFGASLASNQLIQEKLVRMTAMVSSMYLLVERVTKEYMIGKCSLPAISMAKAYNTKLGREVVSLCRESLGGNGIVLDYLIASKFCDMESTYTYEGTYEICTLVCGRALTGVSAIKSAVATKNDLKRRQRINSKL